MCRLARSLAAVFGLAALAGGLVLPIAALALDEAPPDFCCRRGRCCCAEVGAVADEGPCLRRDCGCEREEAVVAGAALSLEAVLPPPSGPAKPGAAAHEERLGCGRPLIRPHVPPVPPPKSPLPA